MPTYDGRHVWPASFMSDTRSQTVWTGAATLILPGCQGNVPGSAWWAGENAAVNSDEVRWRMNVNEWSVPQTYCLLGCVGRSLQLQDRHWTTLDSELVSDSLWTSKNTHKMMMIIVMISNWDWDVDWVRNESHQWQLLSLWRPTCTSFSSIQLN